MPVPVNCPACGKQHQAPDAMAGTMVRCGCGATLQVPSLPMAPGTGGASIFGDVTEADFHRQQGQPAPPPQYSPHANPYQSPAAAMYLAGTPHQGTGSRGGMPGSVKGAAFGLGAAGGISILIVLLCTSLPFVNPKIDETGVIFIMVIGTLHTVVAAADFTAVVMLLRGAPGARIVGFIAAALNIPGSFFHWLFAIIAVMQLLHADTAKYFAQR